MGRAQIIPRLMTKAEAAAYCGLSAGVFEVKCSVRPLEFGDVRQRRWDRHDLDAWIDERKGSPESRSTEDWLREFDHDRNRHAG